MGADSPRDFELVEALRAIAIVAERDGRIVFANSRAMGYEGLFQSDPGDQTLEDLFSCTDAPRDLTARLAMHVDAEARPSELLVVTSISGVTFKVSDLSGTVPDSRGGTSALLIVLEPVGPTSSQWRVDELLEATARMAKVGGWELDARTGKVIWTKETYRIHELSFNQEPPLEEAINFFHPDDQKILSAAISQAFAFGKPYDLQLRLITAKGNLRHTRSICTPIVENGKTIRLRGTFQDITERRLAEEQLKAERLRMAEVLAGTQVGDWQWNVKTKQISFSERWEAVLGYPPAEASQFNETKWINLYHPNDLEASRNLLKECIAGTRDQYAHEVRMRHRGGSWIWIFDRGKVIERELDGRPVLISGIHQDITARKEAEQALRESEARYRDIFEKSSAVKLLIDAESGRIIEANSAACRFYGYSRAEIATLHIWDINIMGEAKSRELLRLAHGSGGASFEFQHRTASGAIRHVEVSTGPVEVGGQQLLHSIIFDVTDRKRAEEELQRMAQLESLGTLAGGIAHDFNNVLTGIFGHVSLARSVLPEDTPAAEFLEGAEKSMERAKRLTRQLLTFAKGGMPITEAVDLLPLVNEVMQFDLSRSSVTPVLEVRDDLWPVSADRGQLQQVFSNLVINARQAMPAGGKLFVNMQNVQVEEQQIPQLPAGRYVRIDIRDEGVGIKPEFLERIFAPYFTTKKDGQGLGLATCYSIVDKHEGHISVESTPNVGTTFTIHLPAANEDVTHENAQPSAGGTKVSPVRVLIMDDDKAVTLVVASMLQEIGCTVQAVQNADQAITAYWESLRDEAPFDVVIMDLTIPGSMGGKDAVRHILLLNPDAYVLCSSGYAEDPVMSNYKAYGFKGSLPKPYTLGQLREAVNFQANIRSQQSFGVPPDNAT